MTYDEDLARFRDAVNVLTAARHRADRLARTAANLQQWRGCAIHSPCEPDADDPRRDIEFILYVRAEDV